MSQTKTELYNMAAQLLGARGRLISSSQASRSGDVFDLWYDVSRKTVLRAAHWPSTRKLTTLPLFKERADGADWTPLEPVPGSKYAFITPSDLLYPRGLSTGEHFTLGLMGDTSCLFGHSPNPILEYTFDQTNTGKWESDLFLTIAYALAAFCAYTVTGKIGIAKDLRDQANERILLMRNSVANQDDVVTSTVSSWHAARGYIGSPTPTRFLYPYGTMLIVGESASVK